MAIRLTRRKLAQYAAKRLVEKDSPQEVMRELAAYLIDSGRTREYELIVRDIEAALLVHGIVIADVVSAFALPEAAKKDIKEFIGGESTYLRESIDSSVLGGVLVKIPGRQLDGTVRRKLQKLRAQEI